MEQQSNFCFQIIIATAKALVTISPLLSAPDKTRLQEIVESLLYFSHCINSTVFATLGFIGKNIVDSTERVAAIAVYLLNL